MARKLRSVAHDTRTARLRLPVAKKPTFVKIAPGISLGYRRNQTAGTWVARVADGKGGNWTKAIGAADDYADADGRNVLDYWQAQDAARKLAGKTDDGKPLTAASLQTRGGDTYNVSRVRRHMPDTLAGKVVKLLTAGELRRWRDALAKEMAPASVNRTTTAMKAALNLATSTDETISNRQTWANGLDPLPNAEGSRNVILDETQVRRIVTEAYVESPEFGLLIEVAAVTGARISQLRRLCVRDLQTDRLRLTMPTSGKGKSTGKLSHRPVPIPASLAERLRSTRPDDAPLLLRPGGKPWSRTDQTWPFRHVAARAGLDPAEVTLYALRHSSIVRQLLAGVPARVVAVNAAARAVKALGIKPGAPAKVPTLQEHLARRAAALAGEQTVSAAPEHAIEDADLFAPAMARGADWGAWKTYVRALFGLPLSDAQMPLFTQCTGRTERPAGGFSESALICGRRSRKSFTMAMTGLYLAAFHDFSRWLGSGEKGVVLICAPDKKQCRTIFIHGLLEAPLLANMVARKTADSIELTNGIVIEVVPASFKSVRGYAILAALIDECAFLPVDEGAADPDHALLDAIRPAMASIPIAKLIIASSPYARRGVLWEAYQRHWARTMRPCSSGRPRPMS
jgi:integrase